MAQYPDAAPSILGLGVLFLPGYLGKMYLLVGTAVTMIAFAANSLLTRVAIEGGYIDPSEFALVRVVSGALVLGMIMAVQGKTPPLFGKGRLLGSVSLAVYLIGFSLAYLTLDAGLGALILFGVVQISMFGFATLTGAAPTRGQIVGGSIAFGGLLLALWPGHAAAADPGGAALMVLAGIGWAVYTLAGRRARDPLAATAANFLVCVPILILLLAGTGLEFSVIGVFVGFLCGGLTSGLGYALWYSVLPKLDGSTAAIVQLSVPILAILAGAALLGETLTLAVLAATCLVIGGIAWSILSQNTPEHPPDARS